MSELKQEVVLKFTPGAFRFMQDTLKKHREFLHKLNPLIKENLLGDVDKIQSVLKIAEKAGKKGVCNDTNKST